MYAKQEEECGGYSQIKPTGEDGNGNLTYEIVTTWQCNTVTVYVVTPDDDGSTTSGSSGSSSGSGNGSSSSGSGGSNTSPDLDSNNDQIIDCMKKAITKTSINLSLVVTLAQGVVDAAHPNGHDGVDIADSNYQIDDASLFAPCSGTVRLVVGDKDTAESISGGYLVVIETDDHTAATCCHLREKPLVVKDQSVRMGTILLGYIDHSGTSCDGAHLHMSFKRYDSTGTLKPIDPMNNPVRKTSIDC